MSKSDNSDKFEQHYDKMRERKLREREVVSDDDAPIPDVPVEQAKSSRTAGRNDPCPCGSGKKFKKCCGKTG